MARPSPNERKKIDANRAAKAKIKSEVDAREQRTRDRVDQIVTTALSRTGSRDGLPTVPDLVEKLEKAYALAMATSQPVAAVSATMAIGRLLGLVIDRSAVAIAQVGPERFHGDIEVQREAVFERIRERVGSARAERFITFMQQEMRNGSGDDGVINAVGRTSPLGQRLKGSQRAYHVRSTPMTGRNVATRRFFSLAPEPDSYALLTHPRHSQRWIRCAVREGRHDVGPGHYSPIYS